MPLSVSHLEKALGGVMLPFSLHENGAGHAQPWIRSISHDSRLAGPDDVFVPLSRIAGSWRNFCLDAWHKGCRCFLLPESYRADVPTELEPYVWLVTSVEEALGPLYHAVYGDLPSTRVAITGTDGKSTTVHLLSQLWRYATIPSGAVGTLGVSSMPELSTHVAFPSGMTTPPQPVLYAQLADFRAAGVNHVVFEVSSHALAQDRVAPIQATAAVFTSFAQDHLDYHGNLFAYWRAKWRLLSTYLQHDGLAIVHASVPIPPSDLATLASGARLLRYGAASAHRIPLDGCYTIHEQQPGGYTVHFDIGSWSWTGFVPLLGAHNMDNLLAALMAFVHTGGDLTSIQDGLSTLKGLSGRLEYVRTVNDAPVYVDYAHTPQGLEQALRTLRPLVSGKLGIVFGCGGNRDATKRPLMGEVAASLADWVVVTDDNPRFEDPDQIRQQIMVGCPTAVSMGDRSYAIGWALSRLQPGDVLLIAGKGHETVQIVGHASWPHSDQACVKAYQTEP